MAVPWNSLILQSQNNRKAGIGICSEYRCLFSFSRTRKKRCVSLSIKLFLVICFLLALSRAAWYNIYTFRTAWLFLRRLTAMQYLRMDAAVFLELKRF